MSVYNLNELKKQRELEAELVKKLEDNIANMPDQEFRDLNDRLFKVRQKIKELKEAIYARD